MKILLLLLYLVIVCPIYVGLLLLFPVFKIIDLGTKRIRWRLTLSIYERKNVAFNKAYIEALKKGIFIDFPPGQPTKAMTSLELLLHLINDSIIYDSKDDLVEDDEEDDEDL